MSMLTVPHAVIPVTSAEDQSKIRLLEDHSRQFEQTKFGTEHILHGGMYSRTVRIPAGIVFTSVLIKVPTMLILNGTCDIVAGSAAFRLTGYNVLACEAGRKTAYITRTDIELTMIFPSKAATVAEAEAEFTDEGDSLLSQTNENDIVITGVQPCQASQLQPHS